MPTFKCPQCGEEFQADSEGNYHCPNCENTIAIHLHVHGKIPWESWRENGRLRAFWETWKQVMSNPTAFFRRVPRKGNFVVPFYFGVICQSFAIILIWSYQAGMHAVPDLLNYIAAFGGYWQFTEQFDQKRAMIFLMALVVVSPIFAAISLFLTSSLYHICLKLFGGAKNGFEATFRVISYSTAAQGLALIPIVGVIVGGIWTLVLDIIGLKEIHETTYTRTIFAVLLPVLFFCGFMVLAVAFIFAAAIGAWVSGMETV